LHVVDVDATADSLKLYGGHDQVAGQHGAFTSAPDLPLRWWLQSKADGAWAWHETPWADLKDHQMRNGESMLGALGRYTDAQVATMQAQVPAPASGRT
ncbi:MAG: hypothetical protein ABR562_03105, partial [Thermoplasmatota archaeon]